MPQTTVAPTTAAPTPPPDIPAETVSAKTGPATTEPETQTTHRDLPEIMVSGANYAASRFGTAADSSLGFHNSDYRFPESLPTLAHR